MESQLLTAFAKEGPWALITFLLVAWIVKQSTTDRQMMYTLMQEFRASIDSLKTAVDKLTNRLEDLEENAQRQDKFESRLEYLEREKRDHHV